MKRLLLLIPVIAIIGCGLFGSKDYFPLAVDNQWVYNLLATMGASDTVATGLYTNDITTKITIGGDDAYIMTAKDSVYLISPDSAFVTTETIYLRDTKDAFLSYSDTTEAPDTFLFKDLKLDKTWTTIVGTDTTVSTVVLQEDVTVPAGTYNDCWKVKMVHNSETPNYYWFGSGTGLVKQSFQVINTDTIDLLIELKSKTIK
jgi:hypothetical protein